MAIEVVMPRLGWTMESGSVVEWRKQDGEPVKAGEILFSVDSDKATVEVEALENGVLHIPSDAPKIGEQVPVGGVLGFLLQPGEPVPSSISGAVLDEPANPLQEQVDVEAGETPAAVATQAEKPVTVLQDGATAPAPAGAPTANGAAPTAPLTASPRARRVAAELNVDWKLLKGSGRTGRIVERDVRQAAGRAVQQARPARVSPLARRMAEQKGVDVDQLAAQTPGKRIVRSDVESLAQEIPIPVPFAVGSGAPLSSIRRITAQRMAESAHSVAPVTLTTEADASELVRLRNQIKADLAGSNQPVPSYNDLLAKLVALTLIEFPTMNSSLDKETIVQHDAVHIGFAVDTERGLFVPVVRDVQAKAVGQIAAESARLVEQVRNGKASLNDLSGGTFTITNLGMYEIDAFTPIINLPQAAILGVGRIVARPIVVDEETEQIAVRKMIALSLTFDHRIVDGAPAARFLQRVKQFVEHPYGWLIR